MDVPVQSVSTVPDELLQYEATALFVERALEVAPQFGISRANARAVAEICRRLEGLPLAIELAAARVKVLPPEAILSRLDRRARTVNRWQSGSAAAPTSAGDSYCLEL